MTCTVSKFPGLTRTPSAQWMKVAMGNKIISMPTPDHAVLNFPSLRTSDASTYRCQGNLSTTIRSQPLLNNSDFNLIAQSESDIHNIKVVSLK